VTHAAELCAVKPWFALRTRSRAEQAVAERLAATCEVFLPLSIEPVQWSDRVHETRRPLFPGYLFARLDQAGRERASYTPGVVQILGEAIEAAQIESIRIVCAATQNLTQCSYQTGELVRIENGPFAGCEGLVDRHQKNTLILRIDLLRRAVSVQIDRTTRLRSLRTST
jgi:transcription antitermination factor NusG